ncbi:MAG: hypothetical protein PHE47_03775 [Oscillospiraceae bacterium]|nr:hypothetical protein [Oscillospiraceae bacterium]
MKNLGTVGERYCPAQQKNVPVEIWWDSDGSRQEQCLHQDGCAHRESYAESCSAPCKNSAGLDFHP